MKVVNSVVIYNCQTPPVYGNASAKLFEVTERFPRRRWLSPKKRESTELRYSLDLPTDPKIAYRSSLNYAYLDKK